MDGPSTAAKDGTPEGFMLATEQFLRESRERVVSMAALLEQFAWFMGMGNMGESGEGERAPLAILARREQLLAEIRQLRLALGAATLAVTQVERNVLAAETAPALKGEQQP